MGLFKDVKKPVIRQAPRAAIDISPLRPKFVEKRPPCSAACPAGADVRGWVTAIARAEACGRSAEQAIEAAWRILVDAHPFPATLGRICPHGCEQACHRRGKDGAIAVNALERSVGDAALARGLKLPAGPRSERTGRVAIVGGGAAGLSCAHQLARRGHQVTVYEARDLPGGRLRDATRTGRLPAAIVDAEIARVAALGIALECGTRVDDPMVMRGRHAAALHDFDFVFVATGRGQRPEASGEQADAVCGVRPTDYGFAGGDAVRPGLVAAALASGRLAALAIDAAINERPVERQQEAPPIAVDRLTLDWYQSAPRHEWPVASMEASDVLPALETLQAEADRCMSCGLCMECERCWMHCTNNCFEKLPKPAGDERRIPPYRVKVETCNGCRKCMDECPCGYIDLV